MCTLVVVVVDMSEKMDDFLEHKVPLDAIIVHHFGNFIPFITFLVFPIYVFITVIFFTSRLAGRSEIVAMLAGGVSFYRILFVPYLFCAALLFLLQLAGNHYFIPLANKGNARFEEGYMNKNRITRKENYHIQRAPGIYYGLETFNFTNNTGRNFTIEVIENKEIKRKLVAKTILYNIAKKNWTLKDYYIRDIEGTNERLITGEKMDTMLLLKKEEINTRTTLKEEMTSPELYKYIWEETRKGRANMEFFVVENYRRTAVPFATFILTLLGFSIASRKTRGGMGWHILMGIALSAFYILMMQFTTTFATNGNFSPFMAVWLPNILFFIIGIIFLRVCPK